MRWSLVAVAGGSAVVVTAFFSLTAEAARMGGWLAGTKCDAENNPLDMVFVVDNELLTDDSEFLTGLARPDELSTHDPRYAFVRHNMRTAVCQESSTSEEDDPTSFKDEPNACVQRAPLDVTNDGLQAALADFMVKSPAASDDAVLTNDGAMAVMAAATSDFRPGSIRMMAIYTASELRADNRILQCDNAAGRSQGLVYYSPYCGSSYVVSPGTVVLAIVKNQITPLIFVDTSASKLGKMDWMEMAAYFEDAKIPRLYMPGSTPTYFVDMLWRIVLSFERDMRCPDNVQDILGLLPFTIGLTDEAPVGSPDDNFSHINFVMLLDDRFTTPEVLESIPSLNVNYAGIRFNRNRVACENGVFAVSERKGCGAPATYQKASYGLEYTYYSDFVNSMKPGDGEVIDPNSSVRSNDLVNVLHGAMVYPLDASDGGSRRVLFIYTRQYPGVEYDSPECRLNRNPRDQFTILCTEDGSGEFGEAWKGLIETETRVVIVIPEQRFSDQKADNEAVRQGWEEAIKATGVGLDRYWIYENVTFAGAVTSFYTDLYGDDKEEIVVGVA